MYLSYVTVPFSGLVFECISFMCRIIFFPIWVFHAVVARGRFSLPAPSIPHNRHVVLFCVPVWSVHKNYCLFNFCGWCYIVIEDVNISVNLFFLDSGHHVMLLLRHHCWLHLNCSFVCILRALMVWPNSTLFCCFKLQLGVGNVIFRAFILFLITNFLFTHWNFHQNNYC